MLILVFNILLAAAAAYAFVRGGGPEKVVATAFLIAAAASYFMPIPRLGAFHDTWIVLLLIDAVLLIVLVADALWANRFWPIWIAAFQIFTLLTHLTMAYQRDILPIVYFVVVSRIAYPMLILLVVGTMLHFNRLRHYGSDPDWSYKLK